MPDDQYIYFGDPNWNLSRSIGLILPPPAGLGYGQAGADDPSEGLERFLSIVQAEVLAGRPLAQVCDADKRLFVYQNGPPRAGGDVAAFIPTMFMFLVNDVVPIVGSIEATYRVGKWVVDIYRRLAMAKTDLGTPLYSDGANRVGVTPEGIKSACLAQAIDEYGLDFNTTTVRAFTRDVFFGNVQHPTTTMNTTVYVHTGSEAHYIYVVSGAGVVIDHILVDSNGITPLQAPKGLEYFGLPKALASSEALQTIVAGPVEVV